MSGNKFGLYSRTIGEALLTSTILDLRNGFLIYQVDVKKVKAQVRSSIFPESS